MIISLACFFCVVSKSQSNADLEKMASLADKLITKDFDASLTESAKGLSLAKNDPAYYGYFLGLKGKAHYFMGHYDSAAVYFSNATAILEKNKAQKQLALISNEYAKLYRKLRKHNEALEWYGKAYRLFESLKDQSGMGMILNESGVVYEYMQQYEKAIENYNLSLIIASNLKDTIGIAYAYNFLGGVYGLKKDFKQAIYYLNKSKIFFAAKKDSFALTLVTLDRARVEQQTGHIDEALLSVDTVIQAATKLSYPELLKDAYFTKYQILQQQGNAVAALQSLELYGKLKDSIYTQASRRQIEELNVKYNVQKIDNEKKALALSVARRNVWIAVVLGILLLTVVLLWFWNRKKALEMSNVLQKEIIKQQDIATKAVIEAEERERNRIAADLHDGVGQLITAAKLNLNSVTDEIHHVLTQSQQNAFDNALSLVDQTAKEVRTVSHNIMPNVLLRSGLGAAVKNFIEKIDDRVIKVELNSSGLNEKVDTNIEMVLYRVIQECVNNVIKHANATSLDISIYNEEQGITVSIEDNGIGFDKANMKHADGIGLKNMFTRIQYLKGELEIDSQPGKGTFISIYIPKVLS